MLDIGKYVTTAVPIAIYVSSYHDFSWSVVLFITITSLILFISGICMVNISEKMEEVKNIRDGLKYKVRLTKNTTFNIEKGI